MYYLNIVIIIERDYSIKFECFKIFDGNSFILINKINKL